ncbi:MAG: hypothetical protein KDC35_18325 [Acidobacteria bacterium]|nr:hypothetical protein [Acidobacteriota bacterium]
MADLHLDVPDALLDELKQRAEQREWSLEEYVLKTLKYHLKKVKSVEADMEESRQTNLMAQNMIVMDPDQPSEQ